MSIMTKGIIGMPYTIAMNSEMSRRQFYSHAQVLLAEIDRLRTAEGDAMTYKAGMENVAQQRDQLKAENERLRVNVKLNLCDYPAIHDGDVDLLIRFIAGTSQAELAEIHQCTPPNISRKIRRVKTRLGWKSGMGSAEVLARADQLRALASQGAVVTADLMVERDQLKAELEKVKADRKACWEEFKVQGRQLDQLKQENRLLTEHNEFLASSDSRLAPELRVVKDALGLDFTAGVIGEVVPLIERLRKLPTCWTEVLEQSEANDQLLDQVLELSAELDGYKQGAQVEADAGDEARAEVRQLKVENEALRKALREVMAQVDGNIRETVRDCVNGHNDVQDIYGYCDTIEAVVGGALLSE